MQYTIILKRTQVHSVHWIYRKLIKNFYQMDQLWWELYNRECGEGLTECEE